MVFSLTMTVHDRGDVADYYLSGAVLTRYPIYGFLPIQTVELEHKGLTPCNNLIALSKYTILCLIRLRKILNT